jgi:hypothetical protein
VEIRTPVNRWTQSQTWRGVTGRTSRACWIVCATEGMKISLCRFALAEVLETVG